MSGPVESAGGFTSVSCPRPTLCVAVGGHFGPPRATVWYNLIESYDGKTWTMVPLATPKANPELSGVSCIISGFCVAIEKVGPSLVRQTLHSDWKEVPTATPHGVLDGISCASPTSCVAVGQLVDYLKKGDLPEPLVESFNGNRWSVTPSPKVPNLQLSAVSCPSPRFCLAVGGSSLAGFGASGSVTEAFQDGKWSVVAPPELAHRPIAATLQGVSCVTARSCIAVGSYARTQTTAAFLVLALHHNRWVPLPDPRPGPYAFPQTVACSDSSSCISIGYSIVKGDKDPVPSVEAGPT